MPHVDNSNIILLAHHTKEDLEETPLKNHVFNSFDSVHTQEKMMIGSQSISHCNISQKNTLKSQEKHSKITEKGSKITEKSSKIKEKILHNLTKRNSTACHFLLKD